MESGLYYGVKNQKNISMKLHRICTMPVINVGEVYFWVKKDGKWSAIDRNNKTIFKSPTILEKYQKLPSLNFEDYIQAQRDGKTCKISVQEASYVYVTNYKYTTW